MVSEAKNLGEGAITRQEAFKRLMAKPGMTPEKIIELAKTNGASVTPPVK